jgi:glycosyltransferase involved in cell wall biosynthesis
MIDRKKKLNILFLASWYPNKLEPQNGNFIQRHAEAVSIHCNVASLYVISSHDAKGYEVERRWINNVFEVIVYYKKTDKMLPFIKYRRYLKAHKKGFDTVLNEFKNIHLTHLNVFYPAGIFALWLKKRFQIPYIITEHWTGFLDINPYKFSLFEKYYILKIGKAASMICPVSLNLQKALLAFGIEGPFKVVPNVVDTRLFNYSEKERKELKKILHVSTLNDQHKNVIGILNVVNRLRKERSDFRLTLAGNKFGDKHLNYAKELGIPDELLLILDEIPLEDIAEFMKQQDIFVLFSNYENLPCVISEAHASGMVVIGTDVGGVSEMIDSENGIVIKAKDEEQLYEALNRLMDNLSKFNAKKISQKAVERYSYQSVAAQFLEIYSGVLTKPVN